MIEGITWFKQSAFLFEREHNLYIDPWGITDGSPKADAILITHAHADHFSPDDIAKIRQDSTLIYATADVAAQIPGTVNVVAPGEAFEVLGWSMDTVPAYNVAPERLQFHPRSNGWVGYVFTIDGVRYYHAGDTDPIPEMESISCDVAFIPIGGYFTMDATEAVEAVKLIGAQLIVPIHFGYVVGMPSDAGKLAKLAAPTPVHVFVPKDPFER
ncbi:MAG TPA: MBL fold metallo-hydrolase [Actinomycetota bacterium]|nr:MBL fold metallo-hydrolase [Actinomycetota bacterium]